MAEDKNEIYMFFKDNELTDRTEKDFLNEYSDKNKAKEIYEFMTDNRLTERKFDDFYDVYLKKKDLAPEGIIETPIQSYIDPLYQDFNGFSKESDSETLSITSDSETSTATPQNVNQEGGIISISDPTSKGTQSEKENIPIFNQKLKEESLKLEELTANMTDPKEKKKLYTDKAIELKKQAKSLGLQYGENDVKALNVTPEVKIEISKREWEETTGLFNKYITSKNIKSIEEFGKLSRADIAELETNESKKEQYRESIGGMNKKDVATISLLKSSKKTYDLYNELQETNVLEDLTEGTKEGLKQYVEDYTKLSETLQNNKQVTNLIKNIQKDDYEITEDDVFLLKAVQNHDKMHTLVSEELPSGYNIGKSIGASVGFMAEFALTGGVGAIGKKAALKTVAKYAAGNKKLAMVSTKLAASGMQTVAMPTFYRKTADRVSKGENFVEALGNSYYETTAENLSENLFVATPAKSVGVARKFLDRTGIATVGGKNIKEIIEGTGKEFVEEKFNEVITSWQNYDNFGSFIEDFSSVKKNFETLGSVSIVSGTMGGLSKTTDVAGNAILEYKINSSGKSIPTEIKSEIDKIIENPDLTIEEKYGIINGVVEDNYNTGNLTEDQAPGVYANTLKYTSLNLMKNAKEYAADQIDSTPSPSYKIDDTVYETKEAFLSELEERKGQDVDFTISNDDTTLEQAKKLVSPEVIEEVTEPVKEKVIESIESVTESEKPVEKAEQAPGVIEKVDTSVEEQARIKEDKLTGEELKIDEKKVLETKVKPKDVLLPEGAPLKPKKEDRAEQEPSKEQAEEISIPKTKKAVSERAISELAPDAPTRTEKDLIQAESEKSPYSQDESFKQATDLITTNTNDAGEIDVDAITVARAKSKINRDTEAVAYSKAHKIYRGLSKDNKISQEQRKVYAEKSADLVNRMANLALESGRTGAIFNKIYEDNPAFDARVRMVESLGKERHSSLKESFSDGTTRQDFINELKQDITNTVNEAVDNLAKENKELRTEIDKLKADKKPIKFSKKRAKQVADNIRKAKLPSDLAFGTVLPVQAVWDGAVETVAKLVEAGGSIADAINGALDGVKNSDWYKGLNPDQKQKFDTRFAEEMEKSHTKKSISDIAKEHWANPADPRGLVEKLREEGGLDARQAKKIKSILAKEVSKRVKQKLINKASKSPDKISQSEADKIAADLREKPSTDEELTNVFAKKYGFSEVTPETAKLLEDIVERIDNLKGDKKTVLGREEELNLNNKIKKLRPKDQQSVYRAINDFQHAAVLSGINTFYNAGIGGAFSLTASALPHLAKRGILPAFFGAYAGGKTAGQNLKEFLAVADQNRGVYDDMNILDEQHINREEGWIEQQLAKPFLHYSKMLFNEESREGVDEFYNELIKHTLTKGLVVNSLIKAQDAFLRGSSADTISAVEEFNNIASEMGYKPFHPMRFFKFPEIAGKTIESLALDKKTQAEIDVQVAEEIKDLKDLKQYIPANYKSRRKRELTKQKGNEEQYNEVLKSTSEWIMMAEPDGIPGWIYAGFKEKLLNYSNKPDSRALGSFLLRIFLLFPRMTANTINAVSRNIPILGMINSVAGYDVDANGKGNFTWIKKDKGKMFQRLVTNGIITATGALLFAEMFDWDDEEGKYVLDPDRLIDFTSYGFGDYKENIKYGINKNFGFRFRTSPDEPFGKWHSTYLAPHIMPIVGFLGRWADDEKGYEKDTQYGDKEGIAKRSKNLINRAASIGDVSLRALGEGQHNSIGRAVTKYKYSKDRGSSILTAVATLMSEPVKQITQPAIVRDAINEGYTYFDKNKKQYDNSFQSNMLRGYYLMDLFESREKLDLYGRSVPTTSKFGEWNGLLEDKYGDTPINKLDEKFPSLRRPDMYYKVKDDPKYTEEDVADASDLVKVGFGSYIEDNIDFFNTLETASELEEAMKITHDRSKRDAKYYLDFKVANPDMSRDEILNQMYSYRNRSSIGRSAMERRLVDKNQKRSEDRKKKDKDRFKKSVIRALR